MKPQLTQLDTTQREGLNIRQLSLADGAWLQRLLNRTDNKDLYAKSAGYFCFTGRNGLSLVSLGTTFALAAAHPNKGNSTLLFYPNGPLKEDLVCDFVGPINSGEVDLARVPEQHADTLAHSLKNRLRNWDVTVIDEDVLDWAFPVHTLDTKRVSEMSGSCFVDFRKNIHRAERLGLESRTIKTPDDLLILSHLVRLWADDAAERYGESEFLQDPYNFLLRNLNEFVPQIDGFITFKDGSPVGFALWQITDPEKGIATSLATVQCYPQKGVSEYLYREMAQRLLAQDIDFVCIGGSETLGLNAFKQKMNPAYSAELKTIRLTPR